MGRRIKFFFFSDKVYELLKINIEANVIIGKDPDTQERRKFKFEDLEQEIVDETVIILD